MIPNRGAPDLSSDAKDGLLNEFLRELSSGLDADNALGMNNDSQVLNSIPTNVSSINNGNENHSMIASLGLNMSMGMYQNMSDSVSSTCVAPSASTIPFFMEESLLSVGNNEDAGLSYDWSTITSQCFSVPHELESSISAGSLNLGFNNMNFTEAGSQHIPGDDALNSFLRNLNTVSFSSANNDSIASPATFQNGLHLNQVVGHLMFPLVNAASSVSNHTPREIHPPISGINLKNYLPQIINSLLADEPSSVLRSSVLISEIAKKDVTRINMQSMMEPANTVMLVNSIIVAITKNIQESKILKNLFSSLYFFSRMLPFVQIVLQTQIIPTIIGLLENNKLSDLIKFYIVSVLHNLCLYTPSSNLVNDIKNSIRTCGGVHRLVPFLTEKNVKFLAIVTDCLHLLAVNHQPTQILVVSLGGIPELINILRNNTNYEKLLYTTCRILKVISVSPECKKAIVSNGGMQVLSSLLVHPSRRLAANAIVTMRNLSDMATDEPDLDQLLYITIRFLYCQLPNSLVQLIKTAANSVTSPNLTRLYAQIATMVTNCKFQEKTMVSCAMGILANLTCNNTHNKLYVFNSDGVEVLLGVCFMAFQSHGTHNDVLEPSICALRHLTSRHPESFKAIKTIVFCAGVQLSYNLLKFSFQTSAVNHNNPISKDHSNDLKRVTHSFQLKRAVLGLFCNVASHELFFPTVRDSGVTSECVQVLNFIYNFSISRDSFLSNIETQTNSTIFPTEPSSFEHSSFTVHLDRTVEAGVGLLFILSRDQNIFNLMIHTKDFLILLYQLLTITQLPGSLDCVLALLYKISEQTVAFTCLSRELLSDSNVNRNIELLSLVRIKLDNIIQSMPNKNSIHFDLPLTDVASNILLRFCNALASISSPQFGNSASTSNINGPCAGQNNLNIFYSIHQNPLNQPESANVSEIFAQIKATSSTINRSAAGNSTPHGIGQNGNVQSGS